jgi:hypothetical protein
VSLSSYLSSWVPKWLQNAWGKNYFSTLGGQLDLLSQQTTQAVLARTPQYGPTDALPVIGDDRSLVQGTSESNPSFIARLINAWSTWTQGGTALGLLLDLKAIGYQPFIVTQQGYRYSLTVVDLLNAVAFGNGEWLCKPGQRTAPNLQGPPGSPWSHFQLLFIPGGFGNLPVSPPAISTWSAGGTPGSGLPLANSAEIATLVQRIQTWMPGNCVCDGIVAITAGGSWGYPFGVPVGGGITWATRASGQTWGSLKAAAVITVYPVPSP